MNAGESVVVYCDSNGLDYLIDALINLKNSSDTGHVHMTAPSAGGNVLDDQNPWGEKAISEVIFSVAR
jgi:hypothetical protein